MPPNYVHADRLRTAGGSGVRRAARRVTALVIAVLAAIALTTSVAASPAHAAPAPPPTVVVPPTLTLDPGSAPAGTAVSAVAIGFSDCLQADPTVEGDPGTVVFFFDSEPVAEAPVLGSSASTSFAVPATQPGAHRVLALCAANEQIRAADSFIVDPPLVEQTIEVPDLGGRSVDDAREMLTELGLELGSVFGEGDRIEQQAPSPGTEVLPGDPVDVVLTGDVTVPNLVGLALDDVPPILLERGLLLGDVVGDGEVVESQSPPPGLVVPRGSTVSVDFGAGPPTEPVSEDVRVPRLVGLSVDDARLVLDRVGLVLASGGADGDALVEAQDPPARALVPSGSAVAITVSVTTSSGMGPGTWLAILLVLAAVAAAGAFGVTQARARRARRWVRGHVQVVPRPMPRPRSAPVAPVRTAGPPRLHHVVRIEPHLDDEGTHLLEEVDR